MEQDRLARDPGLVEEWGRAIPRIRRAKLAMEREGGAATAEA